MSAQKTKVPLYPAAARHGVFEIGMVIGWVPSNTRACSHHTPKLNKDKNSELVSRFPWYCAQVLVENFFPSLLRYYFHWQPVLLRDLPSADRFSMRLAVSAQLVGMLIAGSKTIGEEESVYLPDMSSVVLPR